MTGMTILRILTGVQAVCLAANIWQLIRSARQNRELKELIRLKSDERTRLIGERSALRALRTEISAWMKQENRDD